MTVDHFGDFLLKLERLLLFKKRIFSLKHTHTHPTVLPERHGSFIFLSLASLGLDQISLWEFDFWKKSEKHFSECRKVCQSTTFTGLSFVLSSCMRREKECVQKSHCAELYPQPRAFFSMLYFFSYFAQKNKEKHSDLVGTFDKLATACSLPQHWLFSCW